ncbi:MAG TPA: xylulokinase [Planctomycetaceae bacterium]|nr:xylulokinase [Planctomycetaceae bacterium]
MGYTIGVDIGTSGTKSILIDPDGNILAEAASGYEVAMPKPLWTEQNPDDWWAATVKTIRAVIRQAKVSRDAVQCIGLSGQMHGSVFLDKNGKVLRPALLWNDQRTVKECQEITQLAGGRDELIRMVANPALTGFTAPKILWLRNHEPRRYEKLRHVLLPKDEIRRRLTGELATEVSDASGMLLLDVRNRCWSTELMSKLQLDRSLFAKVYESAEITGTLLPDIANQLGLSPQCKVVGGAGDCAAGAVGTGIVQRGIMNTSLGTSGVMFVHSDQPQFDAQGRLHTFCHAVRGKWHMMGVTLSAAGSLQWFVENVCKELSTRRGADAYQTVNAEAAAISPGSEGLLFAPYLAGERTPHADPLARACFVGLTNKHQRGHLARAVMEGVAMSLRESLEIIRQLDVPVKEMRLSGGGAKSTFWRQILADVMDQAACSINAEQGPAFGVALLAAVGIGRFKSIEEACQATIQVVKKTPPKKSTVRVYNELFPVYQQLYGSLRNVFQDIGNLNSI